MAIKITDYEFKYGGLGYFRGNAHLVELGTHGEKKDPIGPKSYIDPAGKIKAQHLASRPIKKTPPVTINWSSIKKADLETGVALKYFGIGAKTAKTFDYESAKAANLKLMSFSIDENPLKACLNNDATITRNSMKDEGNDARVVNEIWVAMTAELAEYFDTNFSSNSTVTYKDNVLDLAVSGGASGTQTISIGAGTTFAYKMSKVKKWDKDKIEDMESDYKGMN